MLGGSGNFESGFQEWTLKLDACLMLLFCTFSWLDVFHGKMIGCIVISLSFSFLCLNAVP